MLLLLLLVEDLEESNETEKSLDVLEFVINIVQSCQRRYRKKPPLQIGTWGYVITFCRFFVV